jgi:hypothetical protein
VTISLSPNKAERDNLETREPSQKRKTKSKAAAAKAVKPSKKKSSLFEGNPYQSH